MIRFVPISALTISAVMALTGANAAIHAAQPFAGQWDMSLDNTNRKCRVTLHAEPSGANSLAMPFGCKRAMPILSDAAKWSTPAAQELVFADASSTVLLDFSWSSDQKSLVSTGPDGEIYHMQPVGTTMQPANATVLAASDLGLPKPAETPVKPVVLDTKPAPAIGGRYAVLRDPKKPSSCTILLDSGKPNAKGQHKASLEANCIDPGLKVFDPVAWREDNGRLILVAKRGHETSLGHLPDDSWAKDADIRAGKPMALKKL